MTTYRDGKLVSIYEGAPPEAQAIAGLLNANDLRATIEEVGGLYIHVGIERVRVLVFESDVDRAHSLINDAQVSDD